MKTLRKILDVIKNGCVIFTIITVLAYIAGVLFSKEETLFVPKFGQIIIFLIFSIFLAAANLLLKSPKCHVALKLTLHFFATLAIYFVAVVIGGGYIKSGAQTLITLSLFSVLYLIFAIIYAISSSAKNKKKNKKEEYESVFK